MAKTITITAEYAEKMNDPDTTEYRAICQLCADFPAMKIVKRTHRTPRKYVSKSTGEKFNCNQFKNLTYENMETFISGLPNAEQYMTAFNFLKDCGSLPLTSRYTAVRRWFVDQFPEFRKNPLFYLYNEVFCLANILLSPVLHYRVAKRPIPVFELVNTGIIWFCHNRASKSG